MRHPPSMNRPTKAEALSGFRLNSVYPGGKEGVIDLSQDVGRGVFTALADEAFFRTVHVGQFGQIAWSKDIEICLDSAYDDITRQRINETVDFPPSLELAILAEPDMLFP